MFSSSLCILLFQRIILIFHLLDAVEREVAGDGEAVSLDGVELLPSVAGIPDFNHGILHNVLRFLPVESNAKGQSEELVLQRQNIVLETDFFHPSIINDDSPAIKLQATMNYFYF